MMTVPRGVCIRSALSVGLRRVRKELGYWTEGAANQAAFQNGPLTHRCHILETGNDSYRFRNHGTDIKKETKTRTSTTI